MRGGTLEVATFLARCSSIGARMRAALLLRGNANTQVARYNRSASRRMHAKHTSANHNALSANFRVDEFVDFGEEP